MPPLYTVKTPGFTSVGSAPAFSTGNTVSPGVLAGEVTQTSCGILWAIGADDNLNAYATCRFRRQGETAWIQAGDFLRIKNTTITPSRNAVGGSIMRLAPNTTYEVECSLYDSDNGGGAVATLSTTFTTEWTPRWPDTRVRSVASPAALTAALVNGTVPGDRYELASGTYTMPTITGAAAGTYSNRVMFMPAAGATVRIDTIFLKPNTDNWMFFDFTITNRASEEDNSTLRTTFTKLTIEGTNVSFKPCQVRGDKFTLTDCIITSAGGLDAVDISPLQGVGIAAFNEIYGTFDSFSSDAGTTAAKHGNWDIHNNWIHNTVDDVIEGDTMTDNLRVWDNISGPRGGKQGVSYQGQIGGPWYFVGNQWTGLYQEPPSAIGMWKNRSPGLKQWFVNNTGIVAHAKAKINTDHNFSPDCVWANNVIYDDEFSDPGVGALSGVPAYSSLVLMDRNIYFLSSDSQIFQGTSLTSLHSNGVEINTQRIAQGSASAHMSPIPADLREGAADPILPVSGQALIEAGTKTAINGLQNIIGPTLGAAPDAGANQYGIGGSPVGRRTFVSRLAYKATSSWASESVGNISSYNSLGAPMAGSLARLLISRTAPTAFIYCDLQLCAESVVWYYHALHVAGVTGDSTHIAAISFRDGLSGGFVTRGSNRQFLASRIEDGGFLRITGGIATGDYSITFQRDCFYFLRSLWYEWGLPETTSIPSAPTAPTSLGVNIVGLAATLNWTAGSGQTHFLIERKPSAGSYTQIGIATVTNYTDSTIVAGETYTYRVRAIGYGGYSSYSNEASDTAESRGIWFYGG